MLCLGQLMTVLDVAIVNIALPHAQAALRFSGSLAEIGEPVDLVVITVPASGFERAVDDALAVGARAIIGVTSGFAERGEDGRATQNRIVERVRSAGAVLVGPNCLGVSDSTTGLTLTSNPMSSGRVTLLSQSGNMALEIGEELAARGHGLARFVSLGNQADIGLAELIRSRARHTGTDIIAVYCEDFGDGRAFAAAATEAAALGKPVVLLTVGSSEASVRGAKSHTGSLTSGTAVVEAACRAAGVYQVSSPRVLADISRGSDRVVASLSEVAESRYRTAAGGQWISQVLINSGGIRTGSYGAISAAMASAS